MLMIALLGFLVFAIVLGVPMILCFMGTALLPLLTGAEGYSLVGLIRTMVGANSNTYLAIAFFVIAGNIMSKGDISEKVYELFAYFLGNRKGFLPICALLTAAFYGMVSGSAIAVTAAVAALCLPILCRVGYDKNYYAALLCAAGCLGMVIPPSSTVIGVCGIMGANPTVSYRLAMIIGLSCIVLLIICSLFHTRKDEGNRELILQEYNKEREKGFGKVFSESIWALMIPVIILGSIFTELLTATEAAAVSVIYCSLIGVYVYKTLTWKGIAEVIKDSVKTIAPLCMVLASAIAFGNALTALGADAAVTAMLSNVNMGNTGFMLINILIISLSGFFMNTTYMVIPILMPVAQMLNINLELWCSVISSVGSFALLTPPLGFGLMIMSSAADIPLGQMFRKVLPFWLGLTAVASIYAFIPALTAWAM